MKIFKSLRSMPGRLVALGVLAAVAAAIAIPMTASAAPAGTTACKGDLTCIKTFGDNRIGDRLTALTNLGNRVSNDLNANRITSDEASSLQSDISTNKSGLNTLKTKLDAETTAAAALTDVKNIYVQFRVFAVVLPRDNHTLWLDIGGQVAQILRGKQSTISDAISKAPAGEQAQLNTLFTDYQNQLTEAESQMSAGNGILPSLTPDNFNNARTTYETNLTDLRNDTRTAARDLHTAAQDLHKIVAILKSNSTTSAATATPTA
jgi:hypothetical protein